MRLNNRGWGTKEMITMTAFLFIMLGISWYFISKLYDGMLTRNAVTIESSYYKYMENSIKDAAIDYYTDNNLTEPAILSYNLLRSMGYISNIKDFFNLTCTGYVIVNDNSYKPYIRCKDYKTPGYSAELE